VILKHKLVVYYEAMTSMSTVAVFKLLTIQFANKQTRGQSSRGLVNSPTARKTKLYLYTKPKPNPNSNHINY